LQRLLTRKEVCSGCRACEVACVVRHEGCFGVAHTRIKVTKIDSEGLDAPNICRLCRRPTCVAACSTQALSRDEVTGVIHLNEEACIGCSDCVDGCAFGVVNLHSETGFPLICDLCDGDPACVKRCAPGAILFSDKDTLAREKREKMAKVDKTRDGRRR